MQYIAFDSHKHYTLASVEAGERPGVVREQRIPHDRGAVQAFLTGCEAGSPVAVETIGNWYWIIEEIEAAGMRPQLTHARKAKLMLATVNKTDRLDVRGLNRLQRTGTLPTVWIPSAVIRDARDLLRTRMVLVRQRTQLKNRVHATLAKYAVTVPEVSDLFGRRGTERLRAALPALPAQTRFATRQVLGQLGQVERRVQAFERRLRQVRGPAGPAIRALATLPGIGELLATLIAWEVGDVARFPSPAHLAAYAGTTPRVVASGGKVRYGRLRADVNRYLKWAYIEAANVCALVRRRYPQRHVSQLYTRLRARKGHATAIGAVARHLAEASYWVLTRQEPYRDPAWPTASTPASARISHGA